MPNKQSTKSGQDLSPNKEPSDRGPDVFNQAGSQLNAAQICVVIKKSNPQNAPEFQQHITTYNVCNQLNVCHCTQTDSQVNVSQICYKTICQLSAAQDVDQRINEITAFRICCHANNQINLVYIVHLSKQPTKCGSCLSPNKQPNTCGPDFQEYPLPKKQWTSSSPVFFAPPKQL